MADGRTQKKEMTMNRVREREVIEDGIGVYVV